MEILHRQSGLLGGVLLFPPLFWLFIYKWKTAGAKIRLNVQSNRKIFPPLTPEDKTYIMAVATNIGTINTTITHLSFELYKDRFDLLRRKVDQYFYVPKPEIVEQNSVPYVLKPGENWTGIAEEDGKLKEFAKEGIVICCLSHSFHKKSVKKRIQFDYKDD